MTLGQFFSDRASDVRRTRELSTTVTATDMEKVNLIVRVATNINNLNPDDLDIIKRLGEKSYVGRATQ